MQMDINGHEDTIKTTEVMEFRIKANDSIGKVYKVERPYILWIKSDPWNSELHQFETHEEAMEMLSEIANNSNCTAK